MEFKPMPKTPRLSREIVITEKIDGTNASVAIVPMDTVDRSPFVIAGAHGLALLAGSRQRWITPENDNFGFARWVADHAEELVKLGPGHHFGEWWGSKIQRGYGLAERRFSLFNVARWYQISIPHFAIRDIEETKSWQQAPTCCDVVPVLYRGPFNMNNIDIVLEGLRERGSRAAPGFMDPEGIMVYHTAANIVLKKTIKGDESGKHAEAHPKKERPAREPRDPSKGGRRKEQLPIEFSDRRKPK